MPPVNFLEFLPFLVAFIPELREAISSEAGGLLVNLEAGRVNKEDFAKFEELLQSSNERGFRILRDTLGISGPTTQIREGAKIGPAFREELQRRIDAGEDLTEGMKQFTESVPGAFPSFIQGSFDLAREGVEGGDILFDPEAAQKRFGEEFDPIVGELEALPGQVGELTERVQDQFGNLLGEQRTGAAQIQDAFGRVRGDLEIGRAGLDEFFGGLRGELQTGTTDILGRHEGLLGTARGLVSSLGGQERTDINRAFDESLTNQQQALAARGLGSSGILSSIATGVERERTDALGRLQDRLTTQRLGVEETFGLSGLSARERLLGAGINLGGQQAASQERLLGADINLGAANVASQERLLGARLGLGSQQAGALQFGSQLFAGTAAGALGARGNIAAGRLGAFDQAARDKLANLFRFGQIPIQAQSQAVDQAFSFLGPFTAVAPGFNAPANVFPSGSERF